MLVSSFKKNGIYIFYLKFSRGLFESQKLTEINSLHSLLIFVLASFEYAHMIASMMKTSLQALYIHLLSRLRFPFALIAVCEDGNWQFICFDCCADILQTNEATQWEFNWCSATMSWRLFIAYFGTSASKPMNKCTTIPVGRTREAIAEWERKQTNIRWNDTNLDSANSGFMRWKLCLPQLARTRVEIRSFGQSEQAPPRSRSTLHVNLARTLTHPALILKIIYLKQFWRTRRDPKMYYTGIRTRNRKHVVAFFRAFAPSLAHPMSRFERTF